ncbi:Bug family tripartite tricarboxylate transporter substrate binding protein [Neoroseomonas oryzicola]|uniref:Tripartite tricarboxylate transporter substrate binding protein n=1 Tax=Neoroseomonas oryzicola TaxID=535904 RepID=A0A9X9WJI4_9PROT|nr:tripartite tricarboxylate transporter substrate-binding protein [Neoroseomonas oryzicola]MBR0660494.1 tripartite tricarboxylate transporter substrate binding protein [Neoroseomonas oryzicola]NKE18262.1 tripartite tricarboxylate transporter substrate binding protein [Neoroseomonas oryzicola]
MTFARRSLLLAAGATLAAPGLALAQEFPSRPIRVVVPFPAGGTTDLLARLFAQRMTETMGQSVVVENRGGGGGSIGADVVAKAPPDGYTLLFHNITFPTTTATMALAGRPPHDIERDFAPLSLGANVPLIILANPGVPVSDLKGFVDWAKAQPSPPFYGSTGPGSFMNMVGEVLKRDAGIRMEHVPFRGAAPLVQELIAGRVQFGGDQISTCVQHVRSGALKGLANVASRRAPILPDVPTVREQGFPSLELEGWNGFFAPARTPAPVMARLNREIAAAARHPDFVKRCEEVGAEPVGSDADSFGVMVRAQSAKIAELVASVNLRPE